MTQKHFRVQHHNEGGHTLVFAVSGHLIGSAEVYAFQEQVRSEIAQGAQRLVIDLSAIEVINSSGIGILVGLMWSASQAGCGLALASLPPKVEKVLGLTKLLDHVAHAATVQEAMAKLEEKGHGQAAGGI